MENQEPEKTLETTTENVEVENQESAKIPEITAQSDRSPGKDRDIKVKSDASSEQNTKIANQESPEITTESDRSPGKDRGL